MFYRKKVKYFIPFLLAGFLMTGICSAVSPELTRDEAARVSPQYAHQAVTSGKALLVCAYPDQEVCDKIMLEGAISLKEFEAKLPELRKDQEIIFYCA